MAKPAFIYSFDNLGPNRFTELCSLLLASKYKGFLLGGTGSDGGVDGEIDEILGIWSPELEAPLVNEIIKPGETVVFQFKHKVTARVGQAQSRNQLLRLYNCSQNKKCELHRKLILQEKPTAYVLVTNVEVNSNFRRKFIEQCKSENTKIRHYQIIGVDELETWVTMETQLRHLYFPTIFEPPRFNLEIQLQSSGAAPFDEGILLYSKNLYPTPPPGIESIDLLQIDILNVGTVPSYVGIIYMLSLKDGRQRAVTLEDPFDTYNTQLNNPKLGTPIEPGRRHTYRIPYSILSDKIKGQGKNVFPYEILVYDEIGNAYSAAISKDIRSKILE